MSLLVRFRIAVVDWIVRAQEERSAPLPWDDLEGMGRRLAAPPVPAAAPPAVPAARLTKAPAVRARVVPT